MPPLNFHRLALIVLPALVLAGWLDASKAQEGLPTMPEPSGPTAGSESAAQDAPAGLVPLTGAAGALQLAVTDVNYKIAPADILSISVFQEDDLKSLLRVSDDGMINFPLVGNVRVKGLSATSAAGAIAAKLAQGYLINPQVTVTVIEFSKHRFTVLGQVQKPGAYEIPDQQDVTLLQAIGMAGGYTNIADPRKVTLERKVDGKVKLFKFNARRLAEGRGDTGFEVHAGDVISVGESFF